MTIEMKPVVSSNLSAWGYDAESRLLAVQFKGSPDLHHYEGVDAEKAERMAKASAPTSVESIGSLFAKTIRPHHKHIPPVDRSKA